MALAEDARRLIRDPGFRDLPVARQIEVVGDFMQTHDPTVLDLPFDRRRALASELIEQHEPGFLARIAPFIPIVGPIVGAVESPETTGPAARALVEFFGGPEAMQSPMARGLAAGGFETALAGALIPVGGVAARAGLGALGLGRQAIARGAIAAIGEAAPGAARIAAQAARAPLVERVATDFTIGNLFTLAHGLEQQELPGVGEIVANPLLMAGLGGALAGAGRALRYFRPEAVDQGLGALANNPAVRGTVEEAQRLAGSVRRVGRLEREDAGELVFRAAQSEVSPVEFTILRAAFEREPSLLRTDFGLHVLRAQRGHLNLPRVIETGTGTPLRLVYEETPSGGRTRTITIDQVAESEIRGLTLRQARGEIQLVRVEGPADLAARAREQIAPTAPTGEAVPGRPGDFAPIEPGLAPRRGTTPTTLREEFAPEDVLGGRLPADFETSDVLGGRMPADVALVDAAYREALTPKGVDAQAIASEWAQAAPARLTGEPISGRPTGVAPTSITLGEPRAAVAPETPVRTQAGEAAVVVGPAPNVADVIVETPRGRVRARRKADGTVAVRGDPPAPPVPTPLPMTFARVGRETFARDPSLLDDAAVASNIARLDAIAERGAAEGFTPTQRRVAKDLRAGYLLERERRSAVSQPSGRLVGDPGDLPPPPEVRRPIGRPPANPADMTSEQLSGSINAQGTLVKQLERTVGESKKRTPERRKADLDAAQIRLSNLLAEQRRREGRPPTEVREGALADQLRDCLPGGA